MRGSVANLDVFELPCAAVVCALNVIAKDNSET